MMRRSVWCLALGIAGLAPLVGAPFAIAALINSALVRAAQRRFWNAARRYQRCGFALAALGIAVTFAIVAWIAFNAAYPGLDGSLQGGLEQFARKRGWAGNS